MQYCGNKGNQETFWFWLWFTVKPFPFQPIMSDPHIYCCLALTLQKGKGSFTCFVKHIMETRKIDKGKQADCLKSSKCSKPCSSFS